MIQNTFKALTTVKKNNHLDVYITLLFFKILYYYLHIRIDYSD